MRVYVSKVYSATTVINGPIMLAFRREDDPRQIFVRTEVGEAAYMAARSFRRYELIGEFTYSTPFCQQVVDDYIDMPKGVQWTPHIRADGNPDAWMEMCRLLTKDIHILTWPTHFVDITRNTSGHLPGDRSCLHLIK